MVRPKKSELSLRSRAESAQVAKSVSYGDIAASLNREWVAPSAAASAGSSRSNRRAGSCISSALRKTSMNRASPTPLARQDLAAGGRRDDRGHCRFQLGGGVRLGHRDRRQVLPPGGVSRSRQRRKAVGSPSRASSTAFGVQGFRLAVGATAASPASRGCASRACGPSDRRSGPSQTASPAVFAAVAVFPSNLQPPILSDPQKSWRLARLPAPGTATVAAASRCSSPPGPARARPERQIPGVDNIISMLI
jgi:hypothetical protein